MQTGLYEVVDKRTSNIITILVALTRETEEILRLRGKEK